MHRDLKAANVIVTPSGWLKVLDFGLSRRVEQKISVVYYAIDQSWDVAKLHHWHAALYRYQNDCAANRRTRVAISGALGVLLYEMAACHRPFRGGTSFKLPKRGDLRSSSRHQSSTAAGVALGDREVPRQRISWASAITPAEKSAPHWRPRLPHLFRAHTRGGSGGAIRSSCGASAPPNVVRLGRFGAGLCGYRGVVAEVRPARRSGPLAGVIQSVAVLPLENLSR